MKFWNRKNIPENKKIVMTFGSFDFLHAGHEYYLKQAKELGDYLIVIVARDATICSTKGHKPSFSEKQRIKTIKKLGIADLIILGHYKNKHQVILDYKPNVIALGYDQFIFTQTLNKTLIKNNLNCQIIRLQAYFPAVYKSSLIKRKITKENKSSDSANLDLPQQIEISRILCNKELTKFS